MAAPTTDASSGSDVNDPQQLVDYVNAVSSISAYAASVAQTKPPVLELTPPWYAQYIESYELVQSHALTWTNGTLPEIQALPSALLDADPLIQQQLAAATAALVALAAEPTDSALAQSAVKALSTLSSTAGPARTALDDLQTTVATFTSQLTTDDATLKSMAVSAIDAAGADQAEVAKLTTIISQLQQAIATRQEIAHLENLLKGDLAIFLVVVAATVGWLGGPIIEGLLAMTATILTGTVVKHLASEPDIVGLQDQISNVQKEISAESAEVAVIQATANTFSQLAGEGTSAQTALAEISSTWLAEIEEIDAVTAELASASSDVIAVQVAAAQTAVTDVGAQWAALIAAMKILNGVQWQLPAEPTPIAASSDSA